APSIATAVVLLFLSVVKVYDVVVAMTGGGPGIASEVPAKFILDYLFGRANIGLASAASTVLLITAVAAVAPGMYGRSRAERRSPAWWLGLCRNRPPPREALPAEQPRLHLRRDDKQRPRSTRTRSSASPVADTRACRRLRLPPRQRDLLSHSAVCDADDVAQIDGRDPPGRDLRAARQGFVRC